MPPQVVRSSSRIVKEIPILLIGSDLDGRQFTEQTKTVILSLHGAGIVSRHKLSPEQELILRWPEAGREAEIRLVGQVGAQSGMYTYGVAFIDPNLNFWGLEFPPPSPIEIELGLISLVCNGCKATEKIDDSGIEADVCTTNGGVVRFCKRCGCSTVWKLAASIDRSLVSSPSAPQLPPTFLPAPVSSHVPAPPPPANPSPASAPPLSPLAARISIPSSVAPVTCPPASVRASSETAAPPQATAVLTLPAPSPEQRPAIRPADRRRYPRVKVNYSACVHRPGSTEDDIVQCEDMSRGGLRFKSRKRYYEQTFIEVAVPYKPGDQAIFVPAQIVFVQELPEQQFYRCGVAFLKSPKPRDLF